MTELKCVSICVGQICNWQNGHQHMTRLQSQRTTEKKSHVSVRTRECRKREHHDS